MNQEEAERLYKISDAIIELGKQAEHNGFFIRPSTLGDDNYFAADFGKMVAEYVRPLFEKLSIIANISGEGVVVFDDTIDGLRRIVRDINYYVNGLNNNGYIAYPKEFKFYFFQPL
jgi:hypothetical protein